MAELVIIEGTNATFVYTVTDPTSGEPVDPTSVTFTAEVVYGSATSVPSLGDPTLAGNVATLEAPTTGFPGQWTVTATAFNGSSSIVVTRGTFQVKP